MNIRVTMFVLSLVLFIQTMSIAQKTTSSISEAEFLKNLVFQPKNKSNLKFKFAKHAPVIVPNSDTTKYLMVAFNKSSQYGFLLNTDFKVEKSFVNELRDIDKDNHASVVKEFMNQHSDILGSFSRGNQAIIICANSGKTEFGSLMVDFDTYEFKVTVYPIDLTHERFVEGFMYKNNFCVMTSGKKLDFMKFYMIEEYNKVNKPLEIQYGVQYQNLRDAIFKRSNWSKVSSVAVIDYNAYNELGITESYAKLYSTKDNILLTLDENVMQTDVLVFDIENGKMTVKSFPKYKINQDNWGAKSNSFLYYHHLVQTVCSSNKLVVDFVDIHTTQKIKSYEVLREDSINFKNTPLVQEKSGNIALYSSLDGTRILKKTSQLLNKITNSKVAIAINPDKEGNIKVTLGSYLERQQSGGGGGMMMMPGGAIGGAAIFIATPMMYGYNAGKFVKSAYFESSFALGTFEHLKEKSISINDNIIDRIRAYESEIEATNTLSLTNIFRRKNDFIFGFYVSSDDKYSFTSFPIFNK